MWLIFFLLHSTVVLASEPTVPNPDFSTPESTVNSYQQAYDAGSLEAVALCFAPPAKDFYIPPKGERAKITDCKTRKGLPAAKKGDITVIQICKINSNRSQEFHYDLRKFGKDWKIISHSALGAP